MSVCCRLNNHPVTWENTRWFLRTLSTLKNTMGKLCRKCLKWMSAMLIPLVLVRVFLDSKNALLNWWVTGRNSTWVNCSLQSKLGIFEMLWITFFSNRTVKHTWEWVKVVFWQVLVGYCWVTRHRGFSNDVYLLGGLISTSYMPSRQFCYIFHLAFLDFVMFWIIWKGQVSLI